LESDVTLSDVITLNSTTGYTLNLGTYTMTAASGKNAIDIKACGTGDSERNCISVNADSNTPGGINAGSKSVISYIFSNGQISGNDRPIITINGGVFTGGTSSFGSSAGIYFKGGSAARQAATVKIYGGTFNCAIYGQSKSKLLIHGGTFNYSVGSQGDQTAYRQIAGGKFKSFGFMTNDSNTKKFSFGSSHGATNADIYVDDEGYYVVDCSGVSEKPGTYEAVSSGAWNSLFTHSAIKGANKVYCTDATVAMNNFEDVKLFVECSEDITPVADLTLDATECEFSGNVTVKNSSTFIIKYNQDNPYIGTVTTAANNYNLRITETTDANGIVTKMYKGYEITTEEKAVAKVESDNGVEYFKSFNTAFESCFGTTGKTIVLMSDVSGAFINPNPTGLATDVTLDLNGYDFARLSGSNTAPVNSNLTVIDSSITKTGSVSLATFISKFVSAKYIPVIKGGTWVEDTTAYTAEGYKTVDADGLYFVRKNAENPIAELYAPIGASGFSFYAERSQMRLIGTYDSLKEALADAHDSFEIVVINNIVLEEDVTVDKDIDIDLNGYTISPAETEDGAEPAKIVIENDTSLYNGTVECNVDVDEGVLALDEIVSTGKLSVSSNVDSNMIVSGGLYKYPIDSEHIAEGYILTMDEYGYYTIVTDDSIQSDAASKVTEAVKVSLEKTAENKYDIVLEANSDAEQIHRFLSAELDIKLIPSDGSTVTIASIEGNSALNIEAIDPKYSNDALVWGFHLNKDGGEAKNVTANKVVVGTVTLSGYGKATLLVNDHASNKVEAIQSVNGNIVKKYVPADNSLVLDAKASQAVELKVPTKKLTISISFPNAIEESIAAYQNMHVKVTGKDIEDIDIDLGSDGDAKLNANGQYVIEIEDKLTVNNAYNIKVTGAGYRTATYRVTMTDDKVVYFWNNAIKNGEKAYEDGGKVTTDANFLAGDIAEDNIIDKYDLAAVVSYFGKYNLKADDVNFKFAKYDLNRDGNIDSEDIAYVLASFGY